MCRFSGFAASIDVNLKALQMRHKSPYGIYSVFEMHLKNALLTKMVMQKTHKKKNTEQAFFKTKQMHKKALLKHLNALGVLTGAHVFLQEPLE